MSEYRHIANLRGPAGFSFESSTTIDQTYNIDTLTPGLYRVNLASVAGDLGLPGGSAGSLEVIPVTTGHRTQRYTTIADQSPRIWVRGEQLDGRWSDWSLLHPGSGEPRGTLPHETDLDSMSTQYDLGVWHLDVDGGYRNLPATPTTGATLIVGHSNHGSAIYQEVLFEQVRYWRESYSASSLGRWTRVASDAETPSRTIRELAVRDNWLAVYDPTDPATVTTTVEGQIVEIRDSLGNLPPLRPDGNTVPSLRLGEFGALAGLSRGHLVCELPEPLAQPFSVIALAKDDSYYGFQRAFFGGQGTSERVQLGVTSSERPYIGTAYLIRSGQVSRHGSHIWEGRWDATQSMVLIDGQLEHRGLPEDQTEGISHLRLGSSRRTSETSVSYPWQGSMGILLVRGDTDEAAAARMRRTIEALSGINPSIPRFAPTVSALNIDPQGIPTVTWGDPDLVPAEGVASITKILNAIVMRENLSDGDLDNLVTVEASDEFMTNSPNLTAGDQMTYQGLLQSMLISSNNTAPRTIARTIGENLPGSGDAQEKYLEAMRDKLSEWDYYGAELSSNPGGGLRASTRQTADLMRRALEDPVLRDVMSTKAVDVTIEGPDARTATIENTFARNNPYGYFHEWVASKDGTGPNVSGTVLAWTHPSGEEHIAVIQGSVVNRDRRHEETAKLLEAAKSDDMLYSTHVPATTF